MFPLVCIVSEYPSHGSMQIKGAPTLVHMPRLSKSLKFTFNVGLFSFNSVISLDRNSFIIMA